MKAQILIVALLGSLAFANAVPTTKVMPKDLTCDICKLIVTQIDNLLLDGNTIDQIINFVDDICQPLDSIVQGATAACELLIKTQLPGIIDQLVHNQLSPDSVCKLLTACPAVRYEKLMLKQ